VCLYDLLDNCVEFLFLCLIYSVIKILTDYRTVCRDHDNVHAVDITELFLLSLGCTGHAAFFRVLVKEVLECDRCKSSGLSLDVYMLLRLDGLVETVRVTTARHDTSCELIDDQDLIILDHIVLIAEHEVVCTECEDNVVLDLKVLRICKVVDVEECLDLLHTLFCQVYDFLLLIYDEITGLSDLLAHDGVEFIKLTGFLTADQLLCKDIANLIELCGLSALSGNNKRGSRLIDQYGVDLIDDAVVQVTEYHLIFVDRHIVTKIIETELIVRHISDIALVSCFSLLGSHGV